MRSIFKKLLVVVAITVSLTTTAYPQSHSTAPVTVRIHRVIAIDDLERPIQGPPDFRASIAIDGERRWMPEVSGKNINTSSLWVFRKEECGNLVRITIKLYEDDAARRSVALRDEHCDIDPDRGDKDLSLTYHRISGHIAGDVTGRRGTVFRVRGAGDGNRVEIWFSIS